MASSPLFTVSIACYNALEHTKACVASVLANSPMDQIELILTDDASTDGTWEWIKGMADLGCGKVAGRRNLVNLGYPASQNDALDLARGEFFVTLNSDMLIPPRWIEALHSRFAENPRMGAVGIAGTPDSLTDKGSGFPGGQGDYVEGSCAMYRTAVLREIGLYNPRYRRCYFEDSDLSLRLRAAGYGLSWVDLKIQHAGQASMSIARRNGLDVDGLHLYNNEVFLRRWKGYLKTRTFTEKILLKRRMALGDVLMLTPIIARMKAENPNREIDVETEYPAIFRGNPNVRSAYQGGGPSYDQFDRVIDMNLAYELAPEKHVIQAYQDKAGLNGFAPRELPLCLSIYPNAIEHDIASRMLGSSQKWAALHLGPGNVVGRTVPTRLLAAVEKHLKSQGWSVLWIQGGTYSLHVLAALLQQCRLFVGADSGPMHLAQAAQIPAVGIFGAVDPKHRLIPGVPYFRGVTAPEREVGCLGCHHVYEPPMTGSKCLRHGSPQNNLCMEKLRVEDVIQAIEEVLACPR